MEAHECRGRRESLGESVSFGQNKPYLPSSGRGLDSVIKVISMTTLSGVKSGVCYADWNIWRKQWDNGLNRRANTPMDIQENSTGY
jgi:hypothetical protein